jgi:hypothetical protein
MRFFCTPGSCDPLLVHYLEDGIYDHKLLYVIMFYEPGSFNMNSQVTICFGMNICLWFLNFCTIFISITAWVFM